MNARILALAVLLLFGIPAPLRAELLPHVLAEHNVIEARSWFAQHNGFVDRARLGRVPFLFIGDSLTYAWLLDGRETWDARFAAAGAEDFGIGGDRTEDVRWRALNGELDGIAPRAVVLEIGTNDLAIGRSVGATIDGIAACVRAIRSKLPGTVVVLVGVLPKGTGDGHAAERRRIAAVNVAIARLDDGRMVRYVDTGGAFLKPNGELRPELYRFDFIHLSSRGYRVWADALKPALARFGVR